MGSTMSDASMIEKLAEIIKACFSLAGLITVGACLVKNASAAPFHWHSVNDLSGWLAIGLGSVIGVWYAIRNVAKFHASRRSSRYSIGAVAMSCSESP
jgi:hypothetical protein